MLGAGRVSTVLSWPCVQWYHDQSPHVVLLPVERASPVATRQTGFACLKRQSFKVRLFGPHWLLSCRVNGLQACLSIGRIATFPRGGGMGVYQSDLTC